MKIGGCSRIYLSIVLIWTMADNVMGQNSPVGKKNQKLNLESETVSSLKSIAHSDDNAKVRRRAIAQIGKKSMAVDEHDQFAGANRSKRAVGAVSATAVPKHIKTFMMEALDDPSVLQEVTNYKNKMAGIVNAGKQRGDNPMVYSIPLTNQNLAAEVEKTLLSPDGGK